ncbi:MAG: hypothetical protein R3C29_09825 [Dehalococcoidia bacterium]|nr:hypothetical protein [Dehalococcoidia bacterium]MCA9844205.1 hypothetical protein [Dehalococcoidia bacterium]
MLELAPFLISALAFGVIALVAFIASTVIFTIPVFATRGTTQLAWLGAVGFVLTVEAIGLVVLTILVGRGDFLN